MWYTSEVDYSSGKILKPPVMGDFSMFRLERFVFTAVFAFSGISFILLPAHAVELHVAGMEEAYYFDGSDWVETSTDSFPTLFGLWGLSSDDLFAAGTSFGSQDGAIYHYDGYEWTSAAHFPDIQLWGIWGSSGSDIFAVGAFHNAANWGRIVHYDGSSWSVMLETTSGSFDAVWGLGSDDVFAGGHMGSVMHYDGIEWTQIRSQQCEPDPGWYCSETIKGIWGEVGDDIYICGYELHRPDDPHNPNFDYQPFIQRCLGRQYWADKVYLPETIDAYNIQCQEIWGASGTDIFVVACDYYAIPIVYHYDGVAWTIMEDGRGITIWGASGTEVYTADWDSAYHYDGLSWTSMPIGSTTGPFLVIWGDTTSAITEAETPKPGFALEQNYPNPFNPVTTIKYSLTSAQHVTIEIYDVSGARVAALLDGVREAGTHSVQWDGRNSEGRAVQAGVYFCRLVAGEDSRMKKLVLAR